MKNSSKLQDSFFPIYLCSYMSYREDKSKPTSQGIYAKTPNATSPYSIQLLISKTYSHWILNLADLAGLEVQSSGICGASMTTV